MAKVEKRQIILIPLILLALTVLVWQLYQTFFAGYLTTPLPSTDTPVITKQLPTVNLDDEQVPPPSPPPMLSENTPAQQPADVSMPATQQNRSKYLQLVNEYQMAQLQRKIAEQQAAIATARRDAARAQSELDPSGALTTTVVAPAIEIAPEVVESPTKDVLAHNGQAFQVIYIGQHAGEWTAILESQGRAYPVKVGSQVFKNVTVEKISRDGVTIQREGKTQVLTMPDDITV